MSRWIALIPTEVFLAALQLTRHEYLNQRSVSRSQFTGRSAAACSLSR